MLDIKWIADNETRFREALQQRGAGSDSSGINPNGINPQEVLQLNERRKSLQVRFDTLRAEQNQKSKQIGQLQKNQQDAIAVIAAMKAVADQVKALNQEMTEVEALLRERLLQLPNIPHASVPVGADASSNREERCWGERPQFDFQPQDHGAIGEALGILDFERGVKIAGARFTLYKGLAARLERALINFMLDTHTRDHGYTEVLPPFMANAESLLGTGQLPKFEADLFKTTTGHYLIPTAEVPVTNIFRDEILDAAQLPIKFCAYSPCFRSEAGSYGKDVKGLIRQHQFNKVELVQFTKPETSYQALEELTGHAEAILKKLQLPYRVVTLATGDMGFGSAKTYDLEVWLPGQGAYREISSCTNFESFQARRAQIRFKDEQKKNQFVHTLNGSGLAVGRTLVAILENYQRADGTFTIPEVLAPYLT